MRKQGDQCSIDQRQCFGKTKYSFSTDLTDAHSSKGQCNDASLPTVSDFQRLLFGFSVTGWTDAYPSVKPMVTTFVQWTSNGYRGFSTLYKLTPWLIYDVFDALNTWSHPREEKRALWAMRWRSRAWIWSKLEENNHSMSGKCAWA